MPPKAQRHKTISVVYVFPWRPVQGVARIIGGLRNEHDPIAVLARRAGIGGAFNVRNGRRLVLGIHTSHGEVVSGPGRSWDRSLSRLMRQWKFDEAGIVDRVLSFPKGLDRALYEPAPQDKRDHTLSFSALHPAVYIATARLPGKCPAAPGTR